MKTAIVLITGLAINLLSPSSFAEGCNPQQISRGCRTTYHNGHDPIELCACPASANAFADTSDKLILSFPRGSNPYTSIQQSLQNGFSGIHCTRTSPTSSNIQCCSIQNGKKGSCWAEEKFIASPDFSSAIQNINNGPTPGTCTARNCEWADGSCYCGGANGRR